MAQLQLDGMPDRLYPCTPSRLGTWLDCPRRYRMTYLDRPRPRRGPPWAHNSVGASVHNALAGWWHLPARRRTPEAGGTLLDGGWIDEGFCDPDQSAHQRARARWLVVEYLRGVDPGDEPVGVERTVAARTSAIAFSGRIDRLDLRTGEDGEPELVVVDYKTGRHVCDTDDVRGSLALALYAIAAGRVLRRRSTRVELHHLPSATTASWRHTDASLARQLSRAEDIATECAAADAGYRSGDADTDALFPTRLSERCRWCDFLASCGPAAAIYRPHAPWDAVQPA